jgi:hypothetical protein
VWYPRAAHGLLGTEQYTHTNGTTAVSTATWHPTGLDTTSCYRVDALVPDNYSDNPAAVYAVTDARTTVLAAVNENAYTNDWAELGVFQPRSDGTLNVVLDDRGTTGLFVAADAMRFWKTPCGSYGHALLTGPGTPGFSSSTGWTTEPGLGFAGQMRWVPTSGNATTDTPTHSASWIPAAGTLVPNACYEIQAFVPNDHSDNHAARYHVQDQYFADFWPQVEENAFTNQFASLGVFQAWGNGTLPVTLLDDGPSGQFVAADELANTQVDCAGLGNRYSGFHQTAVYIGPGSDPASFTTTDYWYSGIGHGWAHHDLWTHTNGATPVSTATWTTHLNANACYKVAAWIPANFYANNTAADYTVTLWSGGNAVGGPLGSVNQAAVGDVWAPVGQITTLDGRVAVSLDDTGPTGTYTAADTLSFTPC